MQPLLQQKSVIELGFVAATIVQQFSIILRSGEFPGHGAKTVHSPEAIW